MTKVLYVGNFQAKDRFGDCFNTEEHYARGFEANGCTVVRAQENADPILTAEWLDELRREIRNRYDLLLFTRTWPQPPELVDVFREFEQAGTVTAAVHLDVFFGLSREHELQHPMFTVQHVFTADGDHAARFEAHGINHHWMRAGVVEDECVRGTFRGEYDCDVAFVGSGAGYHDEWPHRQNLIDFLRDTYGDRFHKYGGPESATIRGRDLNDLYASAKIVVGDTLALKGNRTHYWSDRPYETLGRGGFLIFPRIGALVREILDLPTFEFGDFGELAIHIDYWLAHPEQREVLRSRLQAHVKANCTYTHRAAELLCTVGLADCAEKAA